MIVPNKKKSIVKPLQKTCLLSAFDGAGSRNSDGNLPCKGCDESFNFDYENNVLIAAQGFERARLDDGYTLPRLPVEADKAKLFFARTTTSDKGNGILILSHDGGLEILPLERDAVWQHVDFDDVVVAVTDYNYMGRDLIFLSGANGDMYLLENSEISTILTDKTITQLVNFNERIFALVKGGNNSLWYSDVFDPFDWEVSLSGGGYIECDNSLGEINKAVSLGDYLYLFCDYGIYRLTCYSIQSQFEMKKIYLSGDRIIGDSVSSIQGKIVFCTWNNAYCFDGSSVGRLDIDLSNYLKDGIEIVSATGKQNKSYLVLSDGCIVAYDFVKGNYCSVDGYQTGELVAVEAKNVSAVLSLSTLCESPVMLSDNNEDFVAQPKRKWLVRDVDFNQPQTQKNIRYVEYKVKGQTLLRITADGVIYEFVLTERNNRVNVNLKAKSFDFEIFNDTTDVAVYPIKLRVDVMR
ncbi:MAG: hypothetical protein ACI4MI_04595 [Christensenellales bacterium]